MYGQLKNEYDDLEQKVINALRHEVSKSETKSKFLLNSNAIKVNAFNYNELAIINDELTFIDSFGLEYSLHSECSLEDLIDILQKI